MDVCSAITFIKQSVRVLKEIQNLNHSTTRQEKDLAQSVFPLFHVYKLFIDTNLSKDLDLTSRFTSLSEALHTVFFLYYFSLAGTNPIESFMHYDLYYDLVVTIMSEFRYAEKMKALGYKRIFTWKLGDDRLEATFGYARGMSNNKKMNCLVLLEKFNGMKQIRKIYRDHPD